MSEFKGTKGKWEIKYMPDQSDFWVNSDYNEVVDYGTDIMCDDYVVLGSGKDKVKQLGNAVTPPAMEWLTQQCVESLN